MGHKALESRSALGRSRKRPWRLTQSRAETFARCARQSGSQSRPIASPEVRYCPEDVGADLAATAAVCCVAPSAELAAAVVSAGLAGFIAHFSWNSALA